MIPKEHRTQSAKLNNKAYAGRLLGYDGDSGIAYIWKDGTGSVTRERNYLVHESSPKYSVTQDSDDHESNEEEGATLLSMVRQTISHRPLSPPLLPSQLCRAATAIFTSHQRSED